MFCSTTNTNLEAKVHMYKLSHQDQLGCRFSLWKCMLYSEFKFVEECILARKYLNKKDGFKLKSVSRSQLEFVCVQLNTSPEGDISQVRNRICARFRVSIRTLKNLLGSEYEDWKAELCLNQGYKQQQHKIAQSYQSDDITSTEILENVQQLQGDEPKSIVTRNQLVTSVFEEKENVTVVHNKKSSQKLFGNFSESEDSIGDCPQLFPDSPIFQRTATQPITLKLPPPLECNQYIEQEAPSSTPASYRGKRKQSQMASQTEEDQEHQVYVKCSKQDCKSSAYLFSNSEKYRIKQMLHAKNQEDIGIKCYDTKIAEELHEELGQPTKEIVYCDIHNVYRWIDEFEVFHCPQCLLKCKIYQKQLKNLNKQCQSLQQQIDNYQNQVQNKQLQIEKQRQKLPNILQTSNQLVQEQITEEKSIKEQLQDDLQEFLIQSMSLQEKYCSKAENLQKQVSEIQREINQLEGDQKQDMLFLMELQDRLQKCQTDGKEKQLDLVAMQSEKQFFLD